MDCTKIIRYSFESNNPKYKDKYVYFNQSTSKHIKFNYKYRYFIIGIDAGNRHIYLWKKKYNIFDDKPTLVPKYAHKASFYGVDIKNLYCGNLISLKIQENNLTKYKNDESYFTYDEHGRGISFCVYINKNYVDVYKFPKFDSEKYFTPRFDKNYYKYFTEKVISIKPLEIFIGKSPKNIYTIQHKTYGTKFNGNSLLIKVARNKYIYIGGEIFSFITKSKIIKFVSEIYGNKFHYFTYPYCIDDQKNAYAILDTLMLTNYTGDDINDNPNKTAYALNSSQYDKYKSFTKKILIKNSYKNKKLK